MLLHSCAKGQQQEALLQSGLPGTQEGEWGKDLPSSFQQEGL